MYFDPPILLHKSSLMQKLADYVRLGFTEYISGVVRAERASAFVRKIARYYRVDLGADRNHRARSKAAGEGCAILLLYTASEDSLSWFLLASPGPHPARSLEKLRSALDREERLVVQGDYELVRHTRSGSRPSWTWRATDKTYRALRQRTIECVRKHDEQSVRQLIRSLYTAPGFAGVRKQVGKTVALQRSEWRRTRGAQSLPTLPARLPYIARLKSESVSLTTWLRRRSAAERNDEP